jgi:protein-disulfide isomerase
MNKGRDLMTSPSKKIDNKLTFVIVIALLIGAAVAASFYMRSQEGTPEPVTEITEHEEIADTTVAEEEIEPVSFDVRAALAERILGDPSAPIKIIEMSSLTCGHCGKFHAETYPKLKEEYIDTGKAYVVFSDFPLNAPALHASMAARCAPDDQYFKLVQTLFETQEDWAYETNYLEILKKKVSNYGVDADLFKECVESEALQKGVLGRMRASQKQWDVKSTPTFVINNRDTFSGALPYEEFERRLKLATGEHVSEPVVQPENPDVESPENTAPEEETSEEAPEATQAPAESEPAKEITPEEQPAEEEAVSEEEPTEAEPAQDTAGE